MNKISKKAFWTRLGVGIVLLILMSTFSLGTFEGVAEAQELSPPTITSIYPASAEQGQTLELTIQGTNFIEGVEVTFYPPEGVVVEAVDFRDAQTVTIIIFIYSDAPGEVGPLDVTVINPDGQNYTLEEGLLITEAKPPVDVTPPPAITGLTATDAHDGKVDLTWWRPFVTCWILITAEDFAYHAIYVSETEIANVTGLSPIAKITDIAVHTYQVTGLKDGTRYYFAVTAVDIQGNELTQVPTASAMPTKGIYKASVTVSPTALYPP